MSTPTSNPVTREDFDFVFRNAQHEEGEIKHDLNETAIKVAHLLFNMTIEVMKEDGVKDDEILLQRDFISEDMVRLLHERGYSTEDIVNPPAVTTEEIDWMVHTIAANPNLLPVVFLVKQYVALHPELNEHIMRNINESNIPSVPDHVYGLPN